MHTFTDYDFSLLYREWKASGKSQEEFCRSRGLKAIMLRNWQRKQKPKRRRRKQRRNHSGGLRADRFDQRIVHVATVPSPARVERDVVELAEVEDVSQA